MHRSKSGLLMSESGQTRPLGDVRSMSGLPLQADLHTSVSPGLKSASYGHMQCSKTHLFDHLVRELLDRQRHLKAKRLGGLQIDDKFEFG